MIRFLIGCVVGSLLTAAILTITIVIILDRSEKKK